MKQLEFTLETRIDNLTFLVSIPSLRMLWSSMNIFHAHVEFRAVVYGLGTIRGVLKVAKARFPVSCGVMAAFSPSWGWILKK